MNPRLTAVVVLWLVVVTAVVVGWLNLIGSGRLPQTSGGQAVFLTMVGLFGPVLGTAMFRRHPDEWNGPLLGATVVAATVAATRSTGLGAMTAVAGFLSLATALWPAVVTLKHPALQGSRRATGAVSWCWWSTLAGGAVIAAIALAGGSVPATWWYTDRPGAVRPAVAALEVGYAAIVVAGALVTVTVAVAGYRRMPGAGRAALRPVVLPLVGWSVATAAGASWITVAGLGSPDVPPSDSQTTFFVILPAVLLGILAAGLGWVDLMVRRPGGRSRAGDAVDDELRFGGVGGFEIGAGGGGAGGGGAGGATYRSGETFVERYLSRALADPSVRVLYPVQPDTDGWFEDWVDSQGRPVVPDLDPDRAVTVIRRGSTLIGMIELDAAVAARPDAVELVATGAGLIMETERLMAAARRDLEQSRLLASRLLSASDQPRAELRAQLISGPVRQLELVRAGLQGGSRLIDVLPQLNAISAEVRRISHGVFPAALATGGLRSALPAVRAPDRRYSDVVEMTAYLAARVDPTATIAQTDPTEEPGLRVLTAAAPTAAVRDRVTALGGRVDRPGGRPGEHGTRWSIVVPNASG